jgi:hypothetical protein
MYIFSLISRTTQNGSIIADQILRLWQFFVGHKINMEKEEQKSPLPVTKPLSLLLPLLVHPLILVST